MKQKNKILISGATGMLGTAILKRTSFLSNVEIYTTSLDNSSIIEGANFIKIESLNNYCFDSFFHCAALVNVNLCESDIAFALRSNVEYTKLLFNSVIAQKYFYISTDSVYEGILGNYSETDKPKPINNYAMSKLQGELEVQKATENYYIVRTNIFGKNSKNKQSLFEWAESQLNQGNNLNGYSNVYFNPLSVFHLADILIEVMNKNLDFGIYNIGSSEYISKYDFLIRAANFLGFSNDLIKPIQFEIKNGIAPRPLNTTINTSKIKNIFNEIDLSIQKSFNLMYNY